MREEIEKIAHEFADEFGYKGAFPSESPEREWLLDQLVALVEREQLSMADHDLREEKLHKKELENKHRQQLEELKEWIKDNQSQWKDVPEMTVPSSELITKIDKLL
jgi:hypothetical protein